MKKVGNRRTKLRIKIVEPRGGERLGG